MVSQKTPPNHLRAWRIHRGFAHQKELARRLGISPATVSRLESGERPYRQNTLERLAQVLDCTPIDLISRDPNDDARRGTSDQHVNWRMLDEAREFEPPQGAGEMKQNRHPALGAMKGTFTIEPGYDLTRPMYTDVEWTEIEKEMSEDWDQIEQGMSGRNK